MTKTGNIESLVELASSQWGLFTSAQALAEGVSRTQLSRMVADGRVELTSYATYRLTAGEETSYCAIKSSWLSLYPKATAYERLKARPRDAVIICRTAAYMHGDAELHEMPYTFAVADGKRTTRTDIELHAWQIDERDIVVIEGLPVTSVERTVADLIRTSEDPSLVGNFISGACARGYVVDEARLAELLAPLAAKNGYDKGDGTSFARKLVADYAEARQIYRAIESFARAIEASPALLKMNEQLDQLARKVYEAIHVESLLDLSWNPAAMLTNNLMETINSYQNLTGIAESIKAAQPAIDIAKLTANLELPPELPPMEAVLPRALQNNDATSGDDSDEVQDTSSV